MLDRLHSRNKSDTTQRWLSVNERKNISRTCEICVCVEHDRSGTRVMKLSCTKVLHEMGYGDEYECINLSFCTAAAYAVIFFSFKSYSVSPEIRDL